MVIPRSDSFTSALPAVLITHVTFTAAAWTSFWLATFAAVILGSASADSVADTVMGSKLVDSLGLSHLGGTQSTLLSLITADVLFLCLDIWTWPASWYCRLSCAIEMIVSLLQKLECLVHLPLTVRANYCKKRFQWQGLALWLSYVVVSCSARSYMHTMDAGLNCFTNPQVYYTMWQLLLACLVQKLNRQRNRKADINCGLSDLLYLFSSELILKLWHMLEDIALATSLPYSCQRYVLCLPSFLFCCVAFTICARIATQRRNYCHSRWQS